MFNFLNTRKWLNTDVIANMRRILISLGLTVAIASVVEM